MENKKAKTKYEDCDAPTDFIFYLINKMSYAQQAQNTKVCQTSFYNHCMTRKDD